MPTLEVNGRRVVVRAGADTPLLWVLREELQLRGTKFGCGLAQCGACTVQLGAQAVRSCVTPLAAARGQALRSIEGLADTRVGRALQQAWLEGQVAQCGYCQSGALMAAAALLEREPTANEARIRQALDTLCRCGTGPRMLAAVQRAQLALARSGP
jgi:isoquinoline 1-oxidoreductase subunit alpha